MEQPLEFSIEEGLLGAAAGDGPPATDLLRKQLKIFQLASQKCLEIQDELAYPGDQGDLDGYLERFSTCEDKAEQLERIIEGISTTREVDIAFDQDEIADCLTYMAYWEEDRDRLHKALAALHRMKEEQEPGSSNQYHYGPEEQQDDTALLGKVVRNLDRMILVEDSEISKRITRLKRALENVNPKSPLASKWAAIGIKSAWLSRVAFARPNAASARLDSLEELIQCFEARETQDPSAAYENYVQSLMSTCYVGKDAPHYRYWDLLKMSTHIQGYFLNRTEKLLGYCRLVVQACNNSREFGINHGGDLSVGIESARKALSLAAGQAAGVQMGPDVHDAIDSAFEDAFLKLKHILEVFELKKADTVDKEIPEATRQDQERKERKETLDVVAGASLNDIIPRLRDKR